MRSPQPLPTCCQSTSPGPPGAQRTTGGFTLVELLIVVVILGILAAVVIPSFGDVRSDAKLSAAHTEFGVFQTALRSYYALNEAWPNDENEGVWPADLDGFISQQMFERPPVLGDHWDWNPDWGPADLQPNIAVHANSPDIGLWQLLDNRTDDGDLNTGLLRRYGDHLCYGVSP